MSVDIKKLTEQQKDVISDTVQYRFYHRITERNVYEWLNNFKQAWSALTAPSVLQVLVLAEGVNRRLKYEV